MGQTSDQISSDIHQTRAELKSNLRELETRVKTATDWRVQFDRHPAVMATAALLGGALLSVLIRRH